MSNGPVQIDQVSPLGPEVHHVRLEHVMRREHDVDRRWNAEPAVLFRVFVEQLRDRLLNQLMPR